jgi:hypothetical protein
MELITCAKVWFSSITKTTWAEWGTLLTGVGLGEGEGDGAGEGLGDGGGVGDGAGVGAGPGAGVGDADGEGEFAAECAVEPPQPAAKIKLEKTAKAIRD